MKPFFLLLLNLNPKERSQLIAVLIGFAERYANLCRVGLAGTSIVKLLCVLRMSW